MVNQGLRIGLPQDAGSPSFNIIQPISGTTHFWTKVSGNTAEFGVTSGAASRFANIATPGSVTLGGTTNVAASANVGSPALRQCIIQAGSIITSAGSVATFPFGTAFSNANYRIVFQTSGVAYTTGAGSYAFVTARNATGCDIAGAASMVYDYIAVGQI